MLALSKERRHVFAAAAPHRYTARPADSSDPMPSHASRGATFALLATLLIWGYSWVVMKQAIDHAGPLQFAALRYVLGAASLFGVMALLRQPLHPPPLRATALIGLCQTTLFQGFAHTAMLTGGAGQVALLSYTMPFWIILLAWPLLHERPQPRHWLGLALAALGLVCIIEPWHGMGSWLSTLLATVGGVGWAAGVVLSKRLMQKHACSPLNLTAWQMLLGAVPLGLLALLVPAREIDWSPTFVALLAYAVLLASGLAWWLWTIVLDRLPATVASVSSLGVPVVGVLLAWLILGEQPSAARGFGIVLVLAGLCVVNGLFARGKTRRSGTTSG